MIRVALNRLSLKWIVGGAFALITVALLMVGAAGLTGNVRLQSHLASAAAATKAQDGLRSIMVHSNTFLSSPNGAGKAEVAAAVSEQRLALAGADPAQASRLGTLDESLGSLLPLTDLVAETRERRLAVAAQMTRLAQETERAVRDLLVRLGEQRQAIRSEEVIAQGPFSRAAGFVSELSTVQQLFTALGDQLRADTPAEDLVTATNDLKSALARLRFKIPPESRNLLQPMMEALDRIAAAVAPQPASPSAASTAATPDAERLSGPVAAVAAAPAVQLATTPSNEPDRRQSALSEAAVLSAGIANLGAAVMQPLPDAMSALERAAAKVDVFDSAGTHLGPAATAAAELRVAVADFLQDPREAGAKLIADAAKTVQVRVAAADAELAQVADGGTLANAAVTLSAAHATDLASLATEAIELAVLDAGQRDQFVGSLVAISDAVLGMVADVEAAAAADARTTMLTIVSAVAAGAVACLVGFMLVLGRVIRPIRSLTGTMERLGRGDLDAEPVGTTRGDELGVMARALLTFRKGLRERVSLADAETRQRHAVEARQAAVDGLVAAFRADASAVLDAIEKRMAVMQACAGELSTISVDATRETGSAEAACQRAADSVSTVAAAAEELNASITEIASKVETTGEAVEAATRQSARASEQVSGLASAAQDIGAVVELISKVAAHTNLLALNATIEAARAGEAGKGFAVVASEVKQLAEQTAAATRQISERVEAIRVASTDAVGAIRSIASTIAEVNATTTAITAAITQQGSATQQISQAAQSAADGTRGIVDNVAMAASAARKTHTSAGDMHRSSSEAAEMNARLHRAVETFLTNIAAA